MQGIIRILSPQYQPVYPLFSQKKSYKKATLKGYQDGFKTTQSTNNCILFFIASNGIAE